MLVLGLVYINGPRKNTSSDGKLVASIGKDNPQCLASTYMRDIQQLNNWDAHVTMLPGLKMA
jgi:hypothetical protein